MLRKLFEDLWFDPPHRQLRRFIEVGKRTGIFARLKEEWSQEVWQGLRRQRIGAAWVYHIHALLHPDRPALKDQRRLLTYREARDEIARLQHSLLQVLKLAPGDRVLLLLENRSEYLTTLFAFYGLGISVVHGSFRATAEEIAYLVEHSGARAIVASSRSYPQVERFLKHSGAALPLVYLEGEPPGVSGYSFEELLERGDPHFKAAVKDPAQNFVYTSGTTGRPKGAYRRLNALSPMDFFRILETLPFRTGERHLVVCPLYHSGAQAFTVMEIALGSTLYLLPEFEPQETVRVMAEEGIESVFMVPTMIRRLLQVPEEERRRFFPQALRALVSGAAPYPHSLRLATLAWLGPERVYDFYGATELGWVSTISGKEMLERVGSVGKPIGGCVIKILDEQKRELPPGKVGVVYVRSPTASEGYWNDPEANARYSWGRYRTVEDLGYLDEDGYLYLQGRARDMIISGGVNIYPAEIERVLEEHPGVREVAVVGVPDPDWGERVVAVVVGRANPPSPEELSRYLKERLASYKIPKDWFFWEELPRNPTGKVLKREIVALLARSSSPPGP